jgi:hypothetical protein
MAALTNVDLQGKKVPDNDSPNTGLFCYTNLGQEGKKYDVCFDKLGKDRSLAALQFL